MAFHYGRDAAITGINNYHTQSQERNALVYHLLRTGGADWLWECDGEVGPNAQNPNHVADGNMEAAGTAQYAVIGTGVIAKDTSIFKAGTQSLKITSNASTDGARTVALLTMTNSIGRSFDAFDSLTGPANEIMTINDNNVPFTTNNVGGLLTISGCPGNNGTFVVTQFISAGSLKYQNPSGGPSSPPPGSYVIDNPYEIALWYRNNTSSTWNVNVDRGDGSPITVGTLPPTGATWTLAHFSFVTKSTGSRYVYFVCTGIGVNELHIDSLLVFRSNYEYQRLNAYGIDGVLANPDTFSSASYVPSAKDVGRWLLIWDPTTPKNTGWYKIITDLGSGVVQVSMRSGTATFTAGTGLTWRIVDIENQFNHMGPVHQYSCGWGLQMPHSSGWRLFMRGNYESYEYNYWATLWAAPNGDATFDMSTGQFYKDGPSTQKSRQGIYRYRDDTTELTHETGAPGNTGGGIQTRTWLMTDDDISFVDVVHTYPAFPGQEGHFFAGYIGSDPTLPGIEEFYLLARTTSALGELPWGSGAPSNGVSWYNGTTFDPQGEAVRGAGAVLGYNAASDVRAQSNASDNPWSGEEVLYPLPILRDPETQYGCPAESEVNGKGLYMGRSNLSYLTTFDSNQYLHFYDGFCWKWSGEAII